MIHSSCTPEAEAATGLFHKSYFSPDKAAPLAILVHGRAGNADVMWAFRRCFPEGVSIIAPQGFLADEVGGWSWWDVREHAAIDRAPSDVTLSSGESGRMRPGIDAAKQKLRDFIQRALEFYGLTPSRTLAAGFSQGAGLLSSLMQQAPGDFAGVALLAGFVLVENPPAISVRPKVFVAHGDQDRVVPVSRCQEGVAFLKARGFPVELVTDPVGHKVGTSGMRGLKDWVGRVLS